MEPIFTLIVIVAVLLPAAVLSNPLPQPPQQGCTDEDLSLLKSALQKATSGKPLPDFSPETLERCPMLKVITGKIQSVASEIVQLRESSIDSRQVDELKESFEQKVNEITKNRDIFEKQAHLQSTQEHGQMIDRMMALQVKVTELEKEIAEKTKLMYEDMAELIFERLQMNSTDAIRNYTRHMMDQKLEALMRKLESDHKVFLGAVRFLNHLNDQNLIDKVFDGILRRLDEIQVTNPKDRENGKYVLVNLLCWTVDNRLLTKKYVEKRPELFRITWKFYPYTVNRHAAAADVRSRQHCDAMFPANFIAWFALSNGK